MLKGRFSPRRLFKTVYGKLVLIFGATLLLMTAVFGVVAYHMSEQYLINVKRQDMEKAVDTVAYLMMQYVTSDEYENPELKLTTGSKYFALRNRLATYHEVLNVDVYIIDLQGKILLSFPLLPGTSDGLSDQVYFSEDFVERFLYDGESYSFINPDQINSSFRSPSYFVDSGNFFGFYKKNEAPHLTISRSIEWYNTAAGYNVTNGAVIMSYPMPELSESKQTVMGFFLISMFALLVLEMVILMIFTRRMTKPLKALKQGAEKIASGDFDLRIERTTEDEIGDVVDAFNVAAKSLENLDQVRNDFIANVSHELRTPMTSIKGFVEGIIDGVIPPENQLTYLKKVHREICRMNDLVNDLLDWA